MIYSSWDKERDKMKLVSLGHFLPFQPPDNPENQNFENNTWIYYHFTHVHHKWQSHDYGMVPEIWNMKEIIFCFFWTAFCPFTPPMDPGNQNFEISKNTPGDIITLTIWCMVPEIWSVKDRVFCHFGSFFALLPHNLQNQNFEKMKKNLEILSFYTSVP